MRTRRSANRTEVAQPQLDATVPRHCAQPAGSVHLSCALQLLLGMSAAILAGLSGRRCGYFSLQ